MAKEKSGRIINQFYVIGKHSLKFYRKTIKYCLSQNYGFSRERTSARERTSTRKRTRTRSKSPYFRARVRVRVRSREED